MSPQISAMHDKMYCIININGNHCPVTNMFDITGNELTSEDDSDDIFSIIALLPSGLWATLQADYFDLGALN